MSEQDEQQEQERTRRDRMHRQRIDRIMEERGDDIVAAMMPGPNKTVLGVWEMIADLGTPDLSVDEILERQKQRDAERLAG